MAALNGMDCITAIELAMDAHRTICISGPPGIGKTSITEQLAAKVDADMRREQPQGMGFGYFVFNGATANLADTIGFLLPTDVEYKTADGNSVSIPHGRYTYPHYYMDRRSKQPAFMFERGLMVIEEYGQASPDVKRALATLIQERRVGDYALPPGVAVCLLTNRASDRSGVGKDFDFVINRRIDIEFAPDLETWLGWANENDVEPTIMAFAARNPDAVFSGKVPEKQGPWTTPRSLVSAGEILKSAAKKGMGLDSPIVSTMLQGCMGAAAVQLLAFVQLRDQLPKLSDIMKDPTTAMVPDRPDGQMIISYELAHRASKDNIDKVVPYMRRLPTPFSVTFVKTALKKTPALLSTREIGDWTRENHQLLAAISR